MFIAISDLRSMSHPAKRSEESVGRCCCLETKKKKLPTQIPTYNTLLVAWKTKGITNTETHSQHSPINSEVSFVFSFVLDVGASTSGRSRICLRTFQLLRTSSSSSFFLIFSPCSYQLASLSLSFAAHPALKLFLALLIPTTDSFHSSAVTLL